MAQGIIKAVFILIWTLFTLQVENSTRFSSSQQMELAMTDYKKMVVDYHYQIKLDSIHFVNMAKFKRDSITFVKAYRNRLYDSMVRSITARKDFRGGVLISDDGEVVYQNSTGFVDYRRDKLVDSSTSFQLASVSKQFTAMAIMILEERKLLSIDSPVVKYLPDFPYKEMKVLHLLQHSSGLPEYINDKKFEKLLPSFAIRNIDLLNILIKNKLPLYYTPGEKYQYSNTGYAMLSLIIEEISDMKYSDFLKKEIFEPLDMKNTYVHNQKNIPRVFSMLFGSRKKLTKSEKLDFITGDKGIYSTIADMHKWDQGLNDCKLVCKPTLEAAFRKGMTNQGKSINYGFGWRIGQTDEGENFVGHYGLWGTFNNAIIRFPGRNQSIIFLGEALKPGFGAKKMIGPLVQALQINPTLPDSIQRLKDSTK